MTSVMPFELFDGQQILRDRQKERVHRMTQVIQSFASGFTLRPITVKLVQGGQAPAFSSSDRIWFHEGKIADLTTKQGVASLKGLTLHEISHILFSPRVGTEFRQWVIDEKMHNAWNALEDQRIESQLIALYPSIRDWFEATMNEYLLKNRETLLLAFPLIHGRKYLDKRVRKMVKQAFKHQDRVAEIASIIDQFRPLNMSKDADTELAKELIARYKELTEDLQIENPNGHDHRSETEHESNINSKPISRSKQEQASDAVEDDDSIYDNFDWDEEEEDGDFDDAGEPQESDVDGDSDVDAHDSDVDGDSEDSDSSSNSDSDGDATEASPSASDTPADDSTLDEIESILNEALQDTLDRLGDKLSHDIDIYNGDVLLEGEELPEPDRFKHQQSRSVSAKASEGAEKFRAELQRLRAEHDPAWNMRVDNGRINPARWEQGCDFEEAFDRYEMGHADATDIEAVILLDVSGSMSPHEVNAHESMWAIKHALDGINALTSVIAYSESSYGSDIDSMTLYSRDEQVGQTMNFIPNQGGTNPTKALQYAQGVLANSNRAIKLLIVITDGEWSDKCLEATEESIRQMREGGVLTSLAWLSSWNVDLSSQNLHGAEIVCHVRDASDLLYLGRSIVAVGVERQLAH